MRLTHSCSGGQVSFPCTPGQLFMGAKLFVRTPYMRTKISSNMFGLYEKIHGFHGNLYRIRKWMSLPKFYILAVTCPILLNVIPNQCLGIGFSSVCCIFILFNLNIHEYL